MEETSKLLKFKCFFNKIINNVYLKLQYGIYYIIRLIAHKFWNYIPTTRVIFYFYSKNILSFLTVTHIPKWSRGFNNILIHNDNFIDLWEQQINILNLAKWGSLTGYQHFCFNLLLSSFFYIILNLIIKSIIKKELYI